VCIGDVPNLARLERVANSVKVDQLQQVFAEAIEEWGDNGNFGFNPQLKYKEQFLDLRVSYMAEVIRQLAQVSPKVVAVVDHDLLPVIEEYWQKIPKKVQ
jgi:hypothetical protein